MGIVNVFITVDSEVYPRTALWREQFMAREVDREIFCRTSRGKFGITFMADRLNAYGLKGVFFVEALFACAVGLAPLRRIIDALGERNQDIQLHVHPEWLKLANLSTLGGRVGYNLNEFSQEEQRELICYGLHNLTECGVRNIRAFRAGNFGADMATLRALAQTGIFIDSSYEILSLTRDGGLTELGLLIQPKEISGVHEFPVAFFEDRPGHRRPAQICAASNRELEAVLLHAWRSGWHSLVLLTHSFELIRNRKNYEKPCVPSWVLTHRFETLCRFLAANTDKFRTCHFADFNDFNFPNEIPSAPLQSPLALTLLRYGEQAASRFV